MDPASPAREPRGADGDASNRRSWALDSLSWPDVGRALARDPRMILAVGAMEQHGPHLPVGANVLIAERIAEAVSERLRILRAPTFSYGVPYSRGPHAGVTGLRRKTLHRAINELLAHWEDDGIAEFVIITAHRFEPHLEALLMALTDTALNSVYDVYQIDTADIVQANPELEHAGELETSLLMHLSPDLVRVSEARDFPPEAGTDRRYTRGRVPTPRADSRGVVGTPSAATAEKGRLLFERFVESIVAAVGPP